MKLPNRTGTICRLSGTRRKPWMVRIYTPEGYAILGYYRLRSEAMTALLQAQGKAPPEPKSPVATLAEVYTMWSFRKYAEIAKAARMAYEHSWSLLDSLHQKPIRYITVSDIEAVVERLDPSPHARTIIKMLLNALFQYAMAHDLADRNPAELANIGKKVSPEDKVVRRPFSYAEVKELFESDNPLAQLALIGIYSGMRPNELLSLTASECDLTTNFFRIAGSKTKSGKNRAIPIHPAISRMVAKLVKLAQISHREALFTNAWNNPVRYGIYQLYIKSLGHTPHDTRHSFATYARKSGMEPLAVKRIMGHTIADLTEAVYTHTSEAQLVSEMLKFSVT